MSCLDNVSLAIIARLPDTQGTYACAQVSAGESSGPLAAFVPAYSGGSVPALHGIPY